ncbi:MAG: hypothetical protein ACKVOQ_16085 [Cyclobacteriaceae bacterium]
MGKIKVTILLIALLITCSCTKEIVPVPNQSAKVFTGTNSKTWKVKFLEQTLNGKIEDTFNVSCATDDEYTLYANAERAYKATTGSKKCSTNEPSVINDSWSFNNASATLSMILPFFSENSLPFIVREAKKSNMVLEIFLDNTNTSSYRVHFESTSEN